MSPIINRRKIQGFNELTILLESADSDDRPWFLIFVGSPDLETGQSWCSDCVEAEPVIESAIEQSAPHDAVLVTVEVGDRATWKDPKNPFRTDERFMLISIPTLMEYGTPNRLQGDMVTHLETVKMLFEDAKSSST